MNFNVTDRDYYLGFAFFPGIGPLRFKLLLEYFGNIKDAWNASEKDLLTINLGLKLTAGFSAFRRKFAVSDFVKTLERKQIYFLVLKDKEYPEMLTQIADPPIVLFFRGNIERLLQMKNKVAVVGTRNMTDYGKRATIRIVSGLVESEVTIVSGMALGIDTVAHRTAIDYNGSTLAVLGTGIDIIYPAGNYHLYWKIVKEKGLVISEYPPGQTGNKMTFPARNRIISGVSKGVVVVEGDRKSGALITAKFALEQGREVFAVPGPITSVNSQASIYLMKNGAQIATDADDIVNELKIEKRY
ncbi:DNA protecting protein DprA [Candidatus Gottesmanbacteria bacterium RBG_16_37_8]|uniref:DNA protecting protein DprA n=1 Tax=Candidatus Gottesmanbacteria bacterium RBG_16_37_8 TaxID=1798371 RepID=A0A1F5YRT8_9BACT|nr:MAG: DNA protecting protein DprA [Candidatus Gottesmanbacteria bacterium RBG_16_37_8]